MVAGSSPSARPSQARYVEVTDSRSAGCSSVAGAFCAYAAAAAPADFPKTSVSMSEFPPRRFAPWMETQAASPAAYRPGMFVSPGMFEPTPPIM